MANIATTTEQKKSLSWSTVVLFSTEVQNNEYYSLLGTSTPYLHESPKPNMSSKILCYLVL
ncbi:MAG: hypothetical protein U0Y96_00195 [Candidatus Kapaibacterium sp.]|nr:hypothetical protein [Bacteroidota bacterium]